ncbi:hypothetical protein AKJ16_DCAP23074 [Drosera capensis]
MMLKMGNPVHEIKRKDSCGFTLSSFLLVLDDDRDDVVLKLCVLIRAFELLIVGIADYPGGEPRNLYVLVVESTEKFTLIMESTECSVYSALPIVAILDMCLAHREHKLNSTGVLHITKEAHYYKYAKLESAYAHDQVMAFLQKEWASREQPESEMQMSQGC